MQIHTGTRRHQTVTYPFNQTKDPMKIIRYIVIRNGTDARIISKYPKLEANEVAIKVTIDAPQPPRIIGEVNITLPEPPPAFVDASVEPYPEDAL